MASLGTRTFPYIACIHIFIAQVHNMHCMAKHTILITPHCQQPACSLTLHCNPTPNHIFAGGGAVPIKTKVILSSHNFENTPSDKALETTLQSMWASGADVAKIATTASDITDCARVLTLIKTSQGMSMVQLYGAVVWVQLHGSEQLTW